MECSYILRLLAFIVSFIVDAIDTISDWLLYHDVVETKAGLVFGRFDDTITTVLLAFSIIGSCMFLFEITVLGVNVTRDDVPVILCDIAALLVIWLEDVPQIIINVVIVSCRDQPISIVQIIKASICMFGALMKLVITAVRFCYWRKQEEKLGSEAMQRANKWVRILAIPGFLIILVGSVMVFSFTQFTWDNAEGSLKFQNPRRLLDGEYNTDKYFDQVGIYVNLQSGEDIKMTKAQWIRLVDIKDFEDEKSVVTHVMFGLGQKQFLSIQKPQGSSSAANFSECYVQNGDFWELQTWPTRCSDTNQQTVSAVINFKFIEPEGHLLLGDIEYNYKVYNNDNCNVVSLAQPPVLTIRYFKSKLAITGSIHHLVAPDTVTESTFYSNTDLQPIEEVWKTGFIGCEYTGKPHPTYNTAISVPCL